MPDQETEEKETGAWQGHNTVLGNILYKWQVTCDNVKQPPLPEKCHQNFNQQRREYIYLEVTYHN